MGMNSVVILESQPQHEIVWSTRGFQYERCLVGSKDQKLARDPAWAILDYPRTDGLRHLVENGMPVVYNSVRAQSAAGFGTVQSYGPWSGTILSAIYVTPRAQQEHC